MPALRLASQILENSPLELDRRCETGVFTDHGHTGSSIQLNLQSEISRDDVTVGVQHSILPRSGYLE